jgi:hypothetical protein
MNERTYARVELGCVFCWFLLDGFWLMEWKNLTYLFSGLSIPFAVMLLIGAKREPGVILVTIADVLWLACNVLWAVADLEKLPKILTLAKFSFFTALGLWLVALAITEPAKRAGSLILRRMRVLKMFEGSK